MAQLWKQKGRWVPAKPVSQKLKIWCRLMRNVWLKKVEVECFCCSRCFRQKSLQNIRRCSGAVGRHFGRRKKGLEGMGMARIWRAPVTGAKWMGLAREGFPFQEEEGISHIIIQSLRIYKCILCELFRVKGLPELLQWGWSDKKSCTWILSRHFGNKLKEF